jgi:hypothetical protein
MIRHLMEIVNFLRSLINLAFMAYTEAKMHYETKLILANIKAFT